jgi:hypothetical protein
MYLAFAVVSVLASPWFGRMDAQRQGTGAEMFSDWAAPTNLRCHINSPFGDQGPAISGCGEFDLYMTTRTKLGPTSRSSGADPIR